MLWSFTTVFDKTMIIKLNWDRHLLISEPILLQYNKIYTMQMHIFWDMTLTRLYCPHEDIVLHKPIQIPLTSSIIVMTRATTYCIEIDQIDTRVSLSMMTFYLMLLQTVQNNGYLMLPFSSLLLNN